MDTFKDISIGLLFSAIGWGLVFILFTYWPDEYCVDEWPNYGSDYCVGCVDDCLESEEK